jgi:membrane-bound lytic murein transglycosylase D
MKKLPAALGLGALLFASGPHAWASPADDDLVQRRAIRGAPVDNGVRETEELRALREFDEQSFPRPIPGAPDSAADDRGVVDNIGSVRTPENVGPDALPDTLRSPTPVAPGAPVAPNAIPWLSSLRLPDMPVRLDPRVVRYLEFYKSDPKGRSIMSSWLRRQGRYRAMIDAALEQAKLPKALLYVSMIESSYDPHDRSHAGAIGLWQFLPENGRIYGLRIDHYVDERKDPEKATLAVMRYLGDLQARFGGWPLSLAAFNAGYGAVLRSIKKYNTNDYWEMCRHEDGLPWETTLYVPKVMAAAIVGENRALFGYDDLVADAALTWDRVFVDTSMSYAAIASAAGVPEAQIATLNPQLRRGRTPPGETRFEVHIPHGTTAHFLAGYDKSKEPVRPYVVRFGERLDEIAASLQMSQKALKTLNGIEDSSEVRPGLTLVVPAGKTPTTPVCDTVVVAVPDKDAVVTGKKRVFYRTLPADTIGDVAHFFGVKSADVLRWNNLDTDARLVGSLVLQLWVTPELDTTKAALVDGTRVRLVTVGSDEFFDLEETKRGRVRLSYTVKAGDDLKKIGKKFGLTVADMERINRFHEQAKPVTVGQKLIVYRAMTASEKTKAMCRLTPGGAEVKPAASDEDDVSDDPDRASDSVGTIEKKPSTTKTDGKDDDTSVPRALPRPPLP